MGSAFQDRKQILFKKYRAKYRADYNAARLVREKTNLMTMGKMEELYRLEEDTQRSEEFVNICEGETQEIGEVLKSEVLRLSQQRRHAYLNNVKEMASKWRE